MVGRLQVVKWLLTPGPRRDRPGLEATVGWRLSLQAGRDGVVPSAGTGSWSFAGSTWLKELENGFAGCLGAGTAAAVAKPESPLDWSAATPLSVLAGSCLLMGNLRPPIFTGALFASPALPSASEMDFVPSTMLPFGLPAHQNHIQALSLNP